MRYPRKRILGSREGLRSTIRAGIVGTALLSVLTLSACAPGGQGTSSSTLGPISKSVPTDQKITLTLASWEVGGNGKAIQDLITAYQTKHPNITIKTSFSSFNDYGQRIKLQMSANDAPDIAQAGQAFTMMGPLVEASLLRPIDDYSKLYGWADRFGPGLLDQSRFEPNGSKFGTGDLYGLALGGNMVGVYFNRDIIAKLGIDTNFSNLDAFQAAAGKAKDAGYIPIELGNSEAWPANHMLSSLISQYADQKDLLAWIYGNKGASFTAKPFVDASDRLATWAKTGLIDPSSAGLSNDDAISRFADGKAAFFVSGNWSLSTIADKMGEKAGFTAFPVLKAGDPARATGATTSPFTISAKTKYPDVAANFLDFMTGPDAASALSSGGYAPLTPGSVVAGSTKLIGDYNKVWSKVLSQDGLTLFLDWSTVGMGNTLFPGIQDLLAGKTTPANLNSAVQAEWEKSHK